MIHRMTLRSNPRLIWLYLLLAAMPLFGLAVFLSVQGIVGVIGLIAAGFITYQLVTFTRERVRARLETTADGLRCIRPGAETLDLRWPDVTQAGLARQRGEKPALFLYAEAQDRLLMLPREFSDFDQLVAHVRQHAPFEELELEPDDSLREWLAQRLGITPEC